MTFSLDFALLLLLNFREAFDMINHHHDINSKHVGFDNGPSWPLSNYLSEMEHFVKLNAVSDNPVVMEMGVPQGSILGPLLFSVYISNFSNYMEQCFLLTTFNFIITHLIYKSPCAILTMTYTSLQRST